MNLNGAIVIHGVTINGLLTISAGTFTTSVQVLKDYVDWFIVEKGYSTVLAESSTLSIIRGHTGNDIFSAS